MSGDQITKQTVVQGIPCCSVCGDTSLHYIPGRSGSPDRFLCRRHYRLGSEDGASIEAYVTVRKLQTLGLADLFKVLDRMSVRWSELLEILSDDGMVNREDEPEMAGPESEEPEVVEFDSETGEDIVDGEVGKTEIEEEDSEDGEEEDSEEDDEDDSGEEGGEGDSGEEEMNTDSPGPAPDASRMLECLRLATEDMQSRPDDWRQYIEPYAQPLAQVLLNIRANTARVMMSQRQIILGPKGQLNDQTAMEIEINCSLSIFTLGYVSGLYAQSKYPFDRPQATPER